MTSPHRILHKKMMRSSLTIVLCAERMNLDINVIHMSLDGYVLSEDEDQVWFEDRWMVTSLCDE
jgi:hypothetical protein